MRLTALFLAGLLLLGSRPALAAAPDDHLHLVRTERDVLIAREYIGRHHDRYRPRWTAEVVTPARIYDVYVARGPARLSEGQFLALIDRSGADPGLIQGIRERAGHALWHGGLALGSFVGSAVAGGIAEVEFGSQDTLVAQTGAHQVAINTAGIAALVLAVTGVVYALFWTADTAARGAPYFRDFTTDEAQQAIDAYNRQLDTRAL